MPPTIKANTDFRNFEDSSSTVRKCYNLMHANQTVDFVQKKKNEYLTLDRLKLNIFDVLEKLNDIIDESDPDIGLPNIHHAYQAAEAARSDHPENKWLQLVALIHDCGKLLTFYGEPHWAVCGDTYPVGCAPSDFVSCRNEGFDQCPDNQNPQYNTKYGMYQPNCGLDKLTMSWGHDEYMYQVLKRNGASIPQEGLNIIRYHSFYSWHSHEQYKHLLSDEDEEALKWVRVFNQYDLYSKRDTPLDIDALRPYYECLAKEFLPDVLCW